MAEIFSTEEVQKGTIFPRLRMKSVEARHREKSSVWKLVRFRSHSAPIQEKGSGSAFAFFFFLVLAGRLIVAPESWLGTIFNLS